MILKMIIGRGWRGVDSYVTSKPNSRILCTNLGGSTTRERAVEIGGLRSRRPGLKRAIGHLVLSHDPALPDLSDDQWRAAIDIARVEHGLDDAPYSAVLHSDKDHRHVHLIFLRLRGDGGVVSDSHNYRKNEVAARRIERELNLPPPTPIERGDESEPPPTGRVRAALGRRIRAEDRREAAQKKRLSKPPMDHQKMTDSELINSINDVLKKRRAVDRDSLTELLKKRGIDVGWTASGGVRFRDETDQIWKKGSGLDRANLAGAAIDKKLAENAAALAAGGVDDDDEDDDHAAAGGAAGAGSPGQPQAPPAAAMVQPQTDVDRALASVELKQALRRFSDDQLRQILAVLRSQNRPATDANFEAARALYELLRILVKILSLGIVDLHLNALSKRQPAWQADAAAGVLRRVIQIHIADERRGERRETPEFLQQRVAALEVDKQVIVSTISAADKKLELSSLLLAEKRQLFEAIEAAKLRVLQIDDELHELPTSIQILQAREQQTHGLIARIRASTNTARWVGQKTGGDDDDDDSVVVDRG